jgi:molecular chaperone HtpG
VDYTFKINLRGVIDLLSNHLYSGPQVFLRELLQNAVDAIRAREQLEPGHAGSVRIELVERTGVAPVLSVVDDGVGLTEDEVHRFLATICESSKRGGYWEHADDFIGRFGIGLLSCFVVSDEVVALTRSARDAAAPVIEWRGRPDGTYAVKVLEHDASPGTQVYLTCKKGHEDLFSLERLRALAAHFGGLLPYPIAVVAGKDARAINIDAPWRRRFGSDRERTRALLDYGRSTFGDEFFDAIPLRSQVGRLDGVAFVLPYSPSPSARRTHRVYHKNMLLSEDAEGLLPDWAFFVKCVVNANELRPTASRETFYEDDSLESAREALGDLLRDYLVGLARHDPRRLERLIALHSLSIKGLAVHDDEFYRLFIDWLPFETSEGTMTLGAYRARHVVVRYLSDLDQFRQVARVAGAQGLCVINAAYTHEAELIAKLPDVFPDAQVELVDPTTLAQAFDELSLEEREEVFELVRQADLVLQPMKCSVEVRKFLPERLPALYCSRPEANLFRSLEQSKEIADPLWSSVLGRLTDVGADVPYAQLFFNHLNPLVRKVARLRAPALRRRAIEMLYVQSLLLGHHPLSARELALLNEGLLSLIEWAVVAEEGRADEP